MMFPPMIKMGSYLIWIEDVDDTDQEFIFFLLEKAMVEKKPRFRDTIGKYGTLRTPI